jgi:uncharacterized protein
VALTLLAEPSDARGDRTTTPAGVAREGTMGQPVVHFEIMGADASALQRFYGALFGWTFNNDSGAPQSYGLVDRAANLTGDGVGIGGGVGQLPPGLPGHLTFDVEVLDVEAALDQAERLGGRHLMGPEMVTGQIEIGLLAETEGLVVGVIRTTS